MSAIKPTTNAVQSRPQVQASAPAAPARPTSAPAAAPSRSAVPSRNADTFESAPAKRPAVSLGGDLPKTELKALPKAAPPKVTENPDGSVTVDLTDGSDSAKVSQNKDGSLTVTNKGGSVTIPAGQADEVTIRGGEGNDTIELDDSVTVGVRLEGGNGNDKLRGGRGNDVIDGGEGKDTLWGRAGNDSMQGGGGDDYVEGGAGNDALGGGDGRDTVYGLDGDDAIDGGAGRDYLDGGKGADNMSGGSGDDQVFGGRGNDNLFGGDGDDVMAAGEGKDNVHGGDGSDQLYVQADDNTLVGDTDTRTIVDMSTTNADGEEPGSNIEIEGDDEFKMRMESDLDALRSIPAGRQMLTELDDSGKPVRIKRAEPGDGNSAMADKKDDAWITDGKRGKGTGGTIFANPEGISLGGEEWANRPPIVGLFHEMVHVNNYVTGTLARGETNGTNNRELAAVGLPYDHDGNPDTPEITADHLSENDLRRQLGLDERPEY